MKGSTVGLSAMIEPVGTHWSRTQIVSEIECLMMRNTKTIPTLIALLPLLGLLGTVTGMIQVFDVMASLGSGNPRAMANGVSAATIPTMVCWLQSAHCLFGR